MKLAVRIYTDAEYPPLEVVAVTLRNALAAMTDRIREGFSGGTVKTASGQPIGEWQYSPTD